MSPPIIDGPALRRVARRMGSSPEREVVVLGLGRNGRVRGWVFLENQAATPHRFRVSPGPLIRALDRGRRLGFRLLVIGHSHPDGGSEPSGRDRAAWMHQGIPLWPGVWMLIGGVERGDVSMALHDPATRKSGSPGCNPVGDG